MIIYELCFVLDPKNSSLPHWSFIWRIENPNVESTVNEFIICDAVNGNFLYYIKFAHTSGCQHVCFIPGSFVFHYAI